VQKLKQKNEDTAEENGGRKTFTDVEVDKELLLAASKNVDIIRSITHCNK